MKVFDQEITSDNKPSVLPAVKISLGLILLMAMLSQNQLDPGPLNLMLPAEGIGNWFGLPGAVVAGFLIEFLGGCGFLLPLSLLLLKHVNSLNYRQMVILDIAMLIALTMGLAQLLTVSGDSGIRVTGLVGEMSALYLESFPGKLITLLIVAGFLIQFAGCYRFNPESYLLLKQLTGAALILVASINEVFKKQLGGVGLKLGEGLAPVSTAVQERLAGVRARSSTSWKTISEKTTGWLIELNPFYRFHDTTGEIPGVAHLDEKGIQELEQRKLLSQTIEELERRSAAKACK